MYPEMFLKIVASTALQSSWHHHPYPSFHIQFTSQEGQQQPGDKQCLVMVNTGLCEHHQASNYCGSTWVEAKCAADSVCRVPPLLKGRSGKVDSGAQGTTNLSVHSRDDS